MKLEVSATRMELLRLKRRVALARRGHKLLKDKQDELMRKFLELVEEYKKMRKEIDGKIMAFYTEYYSATSEYSFEEIKSFFLVNNLEIKLETKIMPVMNLRLPNFKTSIDGDIKCFGVKDANSSIDFAIYKLSDMVDDLIRLSETENNVKELAEELEKTRRRVNALEYILIPDLEETIKYISMKIGEVERSNLTRLMKVKEIVEKH